MDALIIHKEQSISGDNSSIHEHSKHDKNEEKLNELKEKIRDLESQLEYEIDQHNGELIERDNKISQLEEIIRKLENTHNDAEKDEAIFQMSEKLLVLSNKHDELLKEHKLKEEELNHLKQKKKYRNDKTNHFIMTLKKQNEDQKKDYEILNEKYIQLLKEMSDLKKSYNQLKEEKVTEEKIIIESRREEKMQQEDEQNALKILNLRNGVSDNPNLKAKDKDNLSNLRLELEYKDMIIQKLIKSKMSTSRSVQETDYAQQISNNEKKIEELYNKFLDAQSDRDKYRKLNDLLKNEIKHLKEENDRLEKNLIDLKNLRSSAPKNLKQISQFGDLLDNVLKENSVLNNELSVQKKKNLKDVYHYDKEIQMIKSDKLKIIEKFDHKKIIHAPHIYEPVHVTLHATNNNTLELAENENLQNIHQHYCDNSDLDTIQQNNKEPIVMDNLVHLYITDYMENVLNKK